MIVKLLTEHHLGFLSLTGDRRGSSESNMSKCHIVGNLMPRLNYKANFFNQEEESHFILGSSDK